MTHQSWCFQYEPLTKSTSGQWYEEPHFFMRSTSPTGSTSLLLFQIANCHLCWQNSRQRRGRKKKTGMNQQSASNNNLCHLVWLSSLPDKYPKHLGKGTSDAASYVIIRRTHIVCGFNDWLTKSIQSVIKETISVSLDPGNIWNYCAITSFLSERSLRAHHKMCRMSVFLSGNKISRRFKDRVGSEWKRLCCGCRHHCSICL